MVHTSDVAPFTVTGIDSGALYVQQNSREQKVHIYLFTCATTGAIHLEVVTDLSTHTFLLAFRRFTSRRCLPQTVISNNGSTYLAAAEELHHCWHLKNWKKRLVDKEFKGSLSQNALYGMEAFGKD